MCIIMNSKYELSVVLILYIKAPDNEKTVVSEQILFPKEK